MADVGPKLHFLQKEFAFGGRDPGYLEKRPAAKIFKYSHNFVFVKDKLWDINFCMLHKTNEPTKTANINKRREQVKDFNRI